MPNQFNSPEGDIENYFVTEYWLIDQYVGDTLWVWGLNGLGQLGVNDTTLNRPTPITTFSGGTNWKQVAAGLQHSAAIKTDGTLWTWGANTVSGSANGQLGNNGVFDRSTPITTFVGGTNWKQVSCGANHTAAIKTDGTLWTWGRNNNGQLGTNDTTQRNTPVTTFAGGTNWKQVAGGGSVSGSFNAAIKTDGTLWTWGYNFNGGLGIGVNGTGTDRTTPVQTSLGGTNWKQVSCGFGNHTLAITSGTDPTYFIS